MLQSEKPGSTTLAPLSCSGIRPILFTLLLLAVSLSLFGCVRRSRNTSLGNPAQVIQPRANDQQSPQPNSNAPDRTEPPRINLNTSSANVLETLPGIGKRLAERIVEHREGYGPFRRPEHLIIVSGISDRRFRALRDLVTVE